MKKYKTLKEFYPYYLSEHEHKTTKLFHFIGTSFSIMFLAFFYCGTKSSLYIVCIAIRVWFCMGKSLLCRA